MGVAVSACVGCVVAMHREVAAGTFHALLKQDEVSAEDFEQWI